MMVEKLGTPTRSSSRGVHPLSRSLSSRKSKNGHLTIVLKLGTSSICDEKTFHPKLATLSLLVETIVQLRGLGHRVVLVSSGAVGVGLKRMNLKGRPKHVPQVQAVAAVGQGRLMSLYDSLFGQFDVPIAQVLLTRDNVSERATYLNACNTFHELLHMGVLPIVNENDTVSTSEIRFGDNDTLSAITAGMVGADYLFLLTDVDCLYTDNPRKNPDARIVRVVDDIVKLKEEITVTTPGSSLGTGGMVTKLIAADLATAAGCTTVISNSKQPSRVIEYLEQVKSYQEQVHKHSETIPKFEPTIGTTFIAKPNPMIDRKWWILHGLATYGTIYLDDGAVKAICGRQRSSLFAVGIVRVEGKFTAHQSVRLVTVVRKLKGDEMVEVEVEIGKGLTNYAAHEVIRVQGCRSTEIEELLGYMDSEFIVHRDNIVVTNPDVDWNEVVFKSSATQ